MLSWELSKARNAQLFSLDHSSLPLWKRPAPAPLNVDPRAIWWAQLVMLATVGPSPLALPGILLFLPKRKERKEKTTHALSCRSLIIVLDFVLFYLLLIDGDRDECSWELTLQRFGGKSFNVPRAANLPASSLSTLPDRSWQLLHKSLDDRCVMRDRWCATGFVLKLMMK